MPRACGFSDAELVALCPQLRAYAISLIRNPDTADDLVQDTIERMLRYHRHFNPGTSLNAWAFVILRNLCREMHRRSRGTTSRRLERYRINSSARIVYNTDLLPEQPYEYDPAARIDLQRVADKLVTMNGAGRAVFLLALGYSEQAVADELGVAPGTVKSRINRAREKLDAHFNFVHSGRRSGGRASKYR